MRPPDQDHKPPCLAIMFAVMSLTISLAGWITLLHWLE